MTQKLYYADSHQKAFTAKVLSCEQVGEQYEVILDQTAFFPGGGGQLLFPRMAGRLSVVMIVTAEGQIVMPKQFIHAEGLLFARYKTKICRGAEVTILI